MAEILCGRKVVRNSPARVSKTKVASAMEEVHTNIPSTVPDWVKKNPKKKESMLRAIAFSKARKGGY